MIYSDLLKIRKSTRFLFYTICIFSLLNKSEDIFCDEDFEQNPSYFSIAPVLNSVYTGFTHGMKSLILISAFIGASSVGWKIEFDPYKGCEMSVMRLMTAIPIEDIVTHLLVGNIFILIGQNVAYMISLPSLEGSQYGSDIGKIATCGMYGLLHYRLVPNPSWLQILYSTIYCLSVTELYRSDGIISGITSHFTLDLIGLKLLSIFNQFRHNFGI